MLQTQVPLGHRGVLRRDLDDRIRGVCPATFVAREDGALPAGHVIEHARAQEHVPRVVDGPPAVGRTHLLECRQRSRPHAVPDVVGRDLADVPRCAFEGTPGELAEPMADQGPGGQPRHDAPEEARGSGGRRSPRHLRRVVLAAGHLPRLPLREARILVTERQTHQAIPLQRLFPGEPGQVARVERDRVTARRPGPRDALRARIEGARAVGQDRDAGRRTAHDAVMWIGHRHAGRARIRAYTPSRTSSWRSQL